MVRVLRSVYNRAVGERLVAQTHPFGNVYTGIDRTRKRAVDERIIGRLSRLDLRGSAPLALARDLFVFSYCARGMAFVDMAFLRRQDIRDGVVHYVRHKTGQPLSVRLEPCMQAIVARYAGRAPGSPYVFPVLKSGEFGSAYRQYQVALNYYNRQLKRLAALVGLETGLSSYTSRHSWATAARNHEVPLPVISAGLGHTSEHTMRIDLDKSGKFGDRPGQPGDRRLPRGRGVRRAGGMRGRAATGVSCGGAVPSGGVTYVRTDRSYVRTYRPVGAAAVVRLRYGT